MFRLTKRSEYGIMAMRYVATQQNGKSCSARIIADYFNLPPEVLAKIMQRLVKKKLIESRKGKHGGYRLVHKPDQITLGDIIVAIENSIDVIDCATEKGLQCDQFGICDIESPMKKIQRDLNRYFHSITLEDLSREE